MPKRDSAPIGAPCWVDLFTSDPDRSRSFYSQVFGWTAEEPNADFGGYFNFTKDDVMVAGGMVNDGQSGAPDCWSVYLATDDAAGVTKAAAEAGGQVVAPTMAVGDLGTMAVLADVGGAAIGTWQPGLHRGFGVLAEPGAPSWFELHTRDYDTAIGFYRDVFGWDTHVVSDSPEFRYTTLGEGEGQLAGIMDAAAMLPDGTPASWSVYFGAEDTDRALGEIVELGGAVVLPAEDTPYGRIAQATDPTGASFKLVAGM